MKLSKGNRDLILHGSLVKAVFAIAIPVVVNSFLQTMYNLTDTYWLGQLSVDYLAAINLVSPVQNTVINFGSGVTVAGAVMISQYIGAGKPEMARKIANQIFTVAMLFSLLCASVMAVATPGIVGWMGAAPDYFELQRADVALVVVLARQLVLQCVARVNVHPYRAGVTPPALMRKSSIDRLIFANEVFQAVLVRYRLRVLAVFTEG